jgi:membrane-associated phospholipid phosphatase
VERKRQQALRLRPAGLFSTQVKSSGWNAHRLLAALKEDGVSRLLNSIGVPSLVGLLAALCCATALSGQTAPVADSAQVGREPPPNNPSGRSAPWVTRRDAVDLGVAIAATLSLAPLDRPISKEFAEPQWERSRRIHHIAGDVAFLGSGGPFVASAIVAAAGTAVGPPWLQRFAMHNMEAIALATVVNGVGKGIAGRALPGVETNHAFEVGRGFHEGNGPFVSFPSGHTAAAFAMAATIRGEVQRADSTRGPIVGAIAFGAAAAVGLARVVQRMHWLSDLPVAAVIGAWSGRVVEDHSSDPGRAGLVVRGLVVGHDRQRVRVGWSFRPGDGRWD